MAISRFISYLQANIRSFLKRSDLQYLLIFALVLRLCYLMLMLGQLGSEEMMKLAPDTIRYVNVGRDLLGGHIFDEGAVVIFGPGYGAFLALNFFFLGVNPLGVLLVQIILSSAACLMIYRLGHELTGSRTAGYIAGILSATSFTSISLANFVLSDTLFFFLFLLGNLAFVLGFRQRRRSYFVCSGICIGLAALVRSIGQFWPLVMVAFAIILPYGDGFGFPIRGGFRSARRVLVAPLIAVIIMAVWAGRNYYVHDVPMLAFTSAGGPANVAALTLAQSRGVETGDIFIEWERQYQQPTGTENLSYADRFRLYSRAVKDVFFADPIATIRTYLSLVWLNLNEFNELYRAQLPSFSNAILDRMCWLYERSLNYLTFWLSMAGFAVLLLMRRWRAFVYLGTIYLYFALMIGFTRWQGSRLFYPGQIAWSIAIAFLVVATAAVVNRWAGRFGSGIPKPAMSTNDPPLDVHLKGFASNVAQALQVLAERKAYVLLFAVPLLIGVIVLYWKIIFLGFMPAGADTISLGVFARSFLVSSILSYGHVPGWNPYEFCGLPFVDAIHGDIFYPLSFLKFLLSIPAGIGWTFILHIIIAGVAAYLTARQLGLSRPAASFAGLSYAFSGWLNSLIAPGHDSKIYVTALFPLIILFIHRAFQRKAVLYYTLAGLVVGSIILSPHPQMAFFSLGAAAAYGIYRMLVGFPPSRRIRFFTRHSALIIYSVTVGLMIGAIQFLPAQEYVRNSSPRTLYTGEYYYHSIAAGWSLHPEELVSLAVPEFCGVDPPGGGGNYWGRNGMKDNSEYAGLIPLLLAGIGFMYSRHRDRYFFAALAAVAVVYAVGEHTPFHRLIYDYVPLIRFTRAASMIMFLFSAAISLLGAMGVESLLQRYRTGDRGGMRIARYGLLFVSAGLMILAVLFTFQGKSMFEIYGRLLYHDLLGDSWRMARVESYAPIVGWGCAIAAVWTLAVTAAVWLAGRRTIGYLAISLLPLMAVADGVRFDTRFIRTADPQTVLAAKPEVDFIVSHLGYERAFGFALNEGDWQFAHHRIYSPGGEHNNYPVWYYRLIGYGKGPGTNFINPRFANLVGAKYIMTPSNAELASVGYGEGDLKWAGVFDKIGVRENLHRFPRAFLVGKYRVVADIDSIGRFIFEGDDNLRELTFLERAPGESIDSLVSPQDTAEIVTYTPDSIVIRAKCQSPKILVLTDVYYKDWHVFVDGKGKDPMITYGTFRGVILEPGQHTVVWKYIPSTYHTGKMISVGSALYILLVVAVSGIAYGRRRHMAPRPRA